jgi:hypothetical protein
LLYLGREKELRARLGFGAALMRDGAQAPRGGGGFFSARSLSNYMRIVSSGASTLRSAGASLVNSIASHEEDGSRNQVRSLG